MRILNEQWERLSRAIGNLFMPILAKILPYLNAIFMVLTEIINTVATLFGFNTDDYDYFSGIADSVIDLEEGLDGASESAKKLKQGLRGFDKLNVITTPTNASAGVSGSMGTIDPAIWKAFNDAFDEYNSKLENIQMKAVKIRDAIMEWLGFTKEIDEVTGDVSFKFDHITGGTVLGALAVGGTIFAGVKTIFSILSKITGLKLTKPFTALLSSLGKVGSKLGAGVSLSGTATIAGVLVYILAQFTSIRKETQKFADALKSGKLSEYFEIDGIDDVISKIFTLTSLLTGGLIPVLVSLGIEFGIFDDTLSVISEILQPIIDKFVNLGTYLKEELIDFWKKDLEPTFQKLNTIWKENMKPALDELGKFLDDIFLKSGLLKSGFEALLTFVGGVFVVGITLAIDTILIPFKLFFEYIQGMVSGIIKIFTGIIEFITGVFTLNWEQAWTGVKDIFAGIWDVLSTVIKTPINAIILVIESFVNLVISGLNAIIGALNKLSVTIPDWVPEFGGQTWGINISTIKEIKIPRLKTGLDYVPKDYYLAYLDEGERVLTKEENRAYMNNEMMGQNYQNKQTSFNPTFIIQVGDKEVARKVLNDLQDMAKSNGKPITIS